MWPAHVQYVVTHAVPYLPSFLFDIIRALLQVSGAATFLANLPTQVADETTFTSPCFSLRWRIVRFPPLLPPDAFFF